MLTLGVVDKMKVTPYLSLNLLPPAILLLQKVELPYFCWLVLLLLHLRRHCLCLRPRFPSLLSDDALIQALVFWGFILCDLSVVCGMRYGYTFLLYVAVQHHCWKDLYVYLMLIPYCSDYFKLHWDSKSEQQNVNNALFKSLPCPFVPSSNLVWSIKFLSSPGLFSDRDCKA